MTAIPGLESNNPGPAKLVEMSSEFSRSDYTG